MKVTRSQKAAEWSFASPIPHHRLDDEEPVGLRIRHVPVDGFTQEQVREVRRKGSYVQYGPGWSLASEVEAVCRPFASSVTDLSTGQPLLRHVERGWGGGVVVKRLALQREVDALAAAVHRLRQLVVELLAKWRKMPPDGRARLEGIVRDPAHRQAPELAEERLEDGSWVDVLVAHVAALSDDLTAFLEDVMPPPGSVVVTDTSEALHDALRPLDQAARDLEHRIPQVRARRALVVQERAMNAAEGERRARQERQHVSAQLARLGL